MPASPRLYAPPVLEAPRPCPRGAFVTWSLFGFGLLDRSLKWVCVCVCECVNMGHPQSGLVPFDFLSTQLQDGNYPQKRTRPNNFV